MNFKKFKCIFNGDYKRVKDIQLKKNKKRDARYLSGHPVNKATQIQGPQAPVGPGSHLGSSSG